jgi:8-oxo-dGTP pyrophosphatase MutT (NUDIX family)
MSERQPDDTVAERTSRFPTVRWEDRFITFLATTTPPDGYADAAVVTFARIGGAYVLADIEERGWTTPSGRIEPGESPAEAAVRETHEEIGADAVGLRQIGGFAMALDDGRRLWAPTFVCTVTGFGDIPPGSESRGAMVVALADLARTYYRWDAMLAAAFAYAEYGDS